MPGTPGPLPGRCAVKMPNNCKILTDTFVFTGACRRVDVQRAKQRSSGTNSRIYRCVLELPCQCNVVQAFFFWRENIVDLHGLHVAEALEMLSNALEEFARHGLNRSVVLGGKCLPIDQ